MQTIRFQVLPRNLEGVWRQIEMRASHTLEDLHTMIQIAFDWEGDALYSFFMSGEAWDEESEYTLPAAEWGADAEDDEETAATLDLATWQAMAEEDRAAFIRDFEEQTGLPGDVLRSLIADAEGVDQAGQGVRNVETTKLASLNLKEGQSFLYLYDYDEEHEFDIQVEQINAFSDPDAIYPAILDGEGDLADTPKSQS